jgi:multidrug efflux pump subunit AcrB
MFSRFFIDRPIFAAVLSIIITLAGGIAVFALPVAQYPEITPPTVEVSAYYPGANAQVVVDTVGAPIEQQVNGVEDMLYMSSQSTNDGNYTLTVTFRPGTNLNIAQVLVQTRVSLAQPILPDLVKRRGVTVTKKSPSILMIVNLYSPDESRDNLYLSNYATIQLRDELSRLTGVGDITYMGRRDYSMRIWLDPQKMAARNISASDVVNAVQAQNIQVAAGQIGQPPVGSGQVFQYTMTTLGRLSEPKQFGEMIIKNDNAGRLVLMRDVARIEMGAQAYDQVCTLDSQPSVALSIYQLPGSNALDTSKAIRDKMKELKERFPEGVDYKIVYDTTPFIRESINEVFKALRDAVILVAIVVLVFLQNWRSALIPLVAVPVAVVGTFAVMAAVGFSLNNLTLFGLVLAIGIVVDDAIVVVEAVEHHIEHGMSPRDATIRALDEVSGPVVAVGLVLSAVFVPCAFIGGIVGQFFRQFAVTIAVSTLISAFNSLTLSPALSALLLKERKLGVAQPLPRLAFLMGGAWLGYAFLGPWLRAWVGSSFGGASWVLPLAGGMAGVLTGALLSGALNWLLAGFFRVFNVGFNATTRVYTRSVALMLRGSLPVLVIYGGLLYLTYHLFITTPTGFIPQQDKGYLLVNVQLPDAASLDRTDKVIRRMEEIARQTDGVEHTVAIAGQSLLMGANASNFGSLYVMLQDFDYRLQPELGGDAIAARLRDQFHAEIKEGIITVFGAPPVDGLGTAGGFKIMIEDRTDLGPKALQNSTQQVVEDASQVPEVAGLFSSFRADTPWLQLDINRHQARMLGVSTGEIFTALQVNIGSLYVNDFNRFGRTWQVNLQADRGFRRTADDLRKMKVRNDQNGQVPLASFCSIKPVDGPVLLTRYNMYPAAAINGTAAPGVSSGQAISRMETVARESIPSSMRAEWTELAFLQLDAGNTAMLAFLLAVVLVFLVLAAQYESWSLPLAVILVVPMCLLCAVTGVIIARMDINIFTQIGFVVLVGLACKNAILIVEFAKLQRERGATRKLATLEACELRLRPILMTSFAFILGVVPLVLGHGAGAEMRQTLGTAVFAGMLGVTAFGIFLTPVFFYVIQGATDVLQRWRGMPEPVRLDKAEPREHETNGVDGSGNGAASQGVVLSVGPGGHTGAGS